MRNVFVALLLLLCTHAYAQKSGCKIYVTAALIEKHNLEAIYPAVIHIDELEKDYQVGEDGKVMIRDLCAGNYTFHIHAFGYEHYVEVINITGKADLRFKLVHVEHMLHEVSIQDERTHVSLIQNKEQLNKEAIAANSGRTLTEMLQTVNGVSMLSNGGTISKPVIHGMHSNRIVLLNNGVRQEDQQWGGEHAPNIDPFLANNVTVVKGAAGVRYGTDAIAGVVLVEPAPLRTKPGTDGEVNLAGFSNNRMGALSAMAEHNFKELPALTVRLQGTFRKGGNYPTPDSWVANSGVEEKNYSVAAGWKKRHYSLETFYSHFDTKLAVYRGAHTGNQEDLMAAIESPVPLVKAGFTYDIARPMQRVKHDLLKTKLLVETKYGVLNVTHAYQHNYRQEYDVVRIDRSNAQLNLTLNTQSLNANFDHRQWQNLSGSIGIDGFYQENFFQPGDRLFIPNFRSFNGAFYAIERYRGKNWTLEGGLRYDSRTYEVFNPEGADQRVVRYAFDFNNVSGTLGFKHQYNDTWNWSLTLSNAWRAPQPNELFSAGLHHSAARIELGNKTLKPEQAYHVNFEAHHEIKDKLRFDISVYMQYINDYIYLNPGTPIQTIRGFFKSFNYQQTNALLNGSDAMVTYNWNKYLQSTVKASFLRAEDLKKRDWLIQMPSDRAATTTKFTTDINEFFKQFYVGVTGRVVLQQVRIPGNFSTIDYPLPPDTYSLVDFESGVQMSYKGQPVYLSVSVYNALNSTYRDYMDAFRYFLDQQGRNVAVRLRVPFNSK
ncbi:MAG: TonB-dependent receptor [Sphingobacteriales bacterium]|nr:MAG: TonB-dependent receptor [Sphingobacteriales bacterium]